MSIQVDRPLLHPKLILGYHVIPGQWLLQGGTVGGGGTLRWFNDELGYYEITAAREENINSYEMLSREAGNISPGSNGLLFLPYMAGERSPIWNSSARGVLFGLSYDKTRSHIIRAIMEGVGFSLLHNLKTAQEVGAFAQELISVGGSANSAVWTQIKSDITGKKIHVPFSDNATALGAAILAGVGTGIYKDFNDAVNNTVHINRTHYPNEKNKELYEKYYNLYLRLYENVKDLYKEL
jgi:xylulokinase